MLIGVAIVVFWCGVTVISIFRHHSILVEGILKHTYNCHVIFVGSAQLAIRGSVSDEGVASHKRMYF